MGLHQFILKREFPSSPPFVVASLNFSSGDIQGGKQRGGAMARILHERPVNADRWVSAAILVRALHA